MKKFSYKKNRVSIVLGGEISSGGMLDYLLCWINELLENNCQVQVVVNEEITVIPEFQAIRDDLFAVVLLPFSGKSVKNRYIRYAISSFSPFKPKALKLIGKEIQKFNPDYVHIVDETVLLPYLFGFLKTPNIPLIVTIHDYEYHAGQFRSISAFITSKFSRLFIENTDFIPHFHNNCLVPDKIIYRENHIVHEHPLPKKLISNKIIKLDTKIKIGFMGRIEPYKGIEKIPFILEIFERKYGNDYSFLIAGRGAGLDIDKYSKLLGDILIINEFISNEEFHMLMAGLDVLILPYTNATQSGVAYLAKAYDCNVVGYDVGALGEFLKDYKFGNVSHGYTVEDFADKLLDVAQSFIK